MFWHRPVLQTQLNVQNPAPLFAEKLFQQFGAFDKAGRWTTVR
jgi:hypothetical protein